MSGGNAGDGALAARARGETLRHALSWTTWGDRALIVFLAAASVAAILTARPAPGGAVAHVRVRGREVESLPLTEDRRVTVRGRIGETEIAVQQGAVRIVSAPCRRKVCVRMGAASRSGQVIVCVPNEVVVEVDGGGDDRFDAILR